MFILCFSSYCTDKSNYYINYWLLSKLVNNYLN